MPPRRLPLLSIALLLVCLIWGIRSLRHRDAGSWQTVEDRGGLILTRYGVEVEHLAIGLFYDQRLAISRADTQRAIETMTPGLSVGSGPNSIDADGSFWKRVGMGFDYEVDDRPASFTNYLRLRIPLWLLAGLLAIRPVKYAVSRNIFQGSPLMKLNPIVAALCGVILGAAAIFFFMRGEAADATAQSTATATAEPALPGKMAGSPLIGAWRINLTGIKATYDFKEDGTFSLRFTGSPTAALGNAPVHEAFGIWRVDGQTLVMKNTASTTPLTIVGEEESATIVSTSPEALVLINVDRKGRNERLTLARIPPFIPGKHDKPAIIGRWTSPAGQVIDLQPGGQLETGTNSTQLSQGQWTQSGPQLRLRYTPPPPLRNRNDRPSTFQGPAEPIYQILDLSSDGQSLTLLRTDPPSSAPQTYTRSPTNPNPAAPPPGRDTPRK